MPKISVIIPIYNGEKYLRKCLNSVVFQTYKDLEIICVDDGSNDNSLSILNEYKKNDKRFKIISKNNEGLSSARNVGIENSLGDYISFIDSDDWVSLALYDDFCKVLDKINKDIDIYNFNASKILCSDNNLALSCFLNVLEVRNHNSLYDIHTFADFSNPFCGNFAAYNKIYRSDFIKNNNIAFPYGLIFEDQLFYIKTFLRAKSIIVNNNLYYMYNVRTQDNIMNNLGEKSFDIFKIIDLMERDIKLSNLYENLKYAFLQHKYVSYSYLLFVTAQELQEKFYLESQKRIIEASLEKFDEDIMKKLRGYDVYIDIKTLDYISFFDKYKSKVIYDR